MKREILFSCSMESSRKVSATENFHPPYLLMEVMSVLLSVKKGAGFSFVLEMLPNVFYQQVVLNIYLFLYCKKGAITHFLGVMQHIFCITLKQR